MRTFNVIVPLVGFDSDIDTMTLSDGQFILKVERLTKKERDWIDEMWNKPDVGPEECKFKVSSSFQFENSKELSPIYYGCHGIIYQFITALRLFQSGNVGSLFIKDVIDFQDNEPILFTTYSDDLSCEPERWLRGEEEYFLSKDNVEDLKRIFDKLGNPGASKKFKRLDIGLKRFNRAYHRSSYEDKIIDIAIVLESTLLFGVNEELKYRLAFRGAALLAKNRSPETTFKVLRMFYDIRSRIVHDGESYLDLVDEKNTFGKKVQKVVKNPDPEFMPLVMQITREVLLEYLNRSDEDKLGVINNGLEKRLMASMDYHKE